MKQVLAAGILSALLLAGCAGTPDGIPAAQAVSLTQFDAVAQVVAAPDGGLAVVERDGEIWLYDEGRNTKQLIFTVPRAISTNGERGLVSLAFHPDFASNGQAFAAYSTDNQGPHDGKGGHSFVVRLTAKDPASLRLGLDETETLIQVDWVNWYHNIGMLRFGPDGMLYIAVGDGSEALPAQDRGDLKGSILRINVDGASGYSIPADNPHVNDPNARGEVFLHGLRNAWRFDFNGEQVFIAEVGSQEREEVDLFDPTTRPQRNFGWPHYEGRMEWRTYDDHPAPANDALNWPIAEYDHDDGCAVIGGVVYDGDQFPGLRGRFVVADHCGADLRILDAVGGVLNSWFVVPNERINSIDADADGELIVSGFSGRIYRVVPA